MDEAEFQRRVLDLASAAHCKWDFRFTGVTEEWVADTLGTLGWTDFFVFIVEKRAVNWRRMLLMVS